jgi:hypothetical protein
MTTFLLGVVAGVLVSALLVLAVRSDLRALPRLWRDEPDCNLRTWFSALRSVVHEQDLRLERCPACGQTHLLSNRRRELP